MIAVIWQGREKMSNKLIKAKDLEAKIVRKKRIWKLCAVLLGSVIVLFCSFGRGWQ